MAEHDLHSIAFPTLDEAQITRLSGCTAAVSKSFKDGQTLFAVGDRNVKFFVVKSGEVEIVDYSGDEPRRVTVHRKGGFTGDVSHLTGTPAVVSAIARGLCEVIEISGDALRRVLSQCPDLSDIILQAFIARRQLLQQSPDFTGLRVENYLGFPTGLTGSELAGRAVLQANKFGAHLSISTPVTHLEFDKVYPVLHLEGGETVTAKCLLIASGAEYRRLGVEDGSRYEGTGVYYAATPNEAQL